MLLLCLEVSLALEVVNEETDGSEAEWPSGSETALSLMVKSPTVPLRIPAIILITTGIQICHGKESKSS